MKLFFFLAATCLLVPQFASARAPENNLERSFAIARKKQVKSVSYELDLELKKGEAEYKGKVRINVELAPASNALSIDWHGRKIESLTVDGKTISEFKEKKGWLEIPAKYLKASGGVNADDRNLHIIEIAFTNTFGTEGTGFQRVIDPEDKNEYIYTDFEPYQAHELFPCFDQPDLKAELTLSIAAPTDWIVIGNERAAREEKVSPETTRTFFHPSRPLSSYLYFVGAGPFTAWKDMEGELPLLIYARKSLAKYVDAPALFHSSKLGLRFFTEYFGQPYPFSKYALVFVPEFGWGGMENPGAITLNERNIFRGPVPASRLEGRDSLILHEMAHMWFGDLVTMKWWNDLWLNESFATYLATIAQDRALGSKSAWLNFASSKTWGYWQDQLVTTHPIETPVKDVRTGKGNFDGITYSKGAAALQQLHFFVGEEAFRNGLRSYFQKYAFQNATRADFISEIAMAAERDLGPWIKAWLQSSGPNKVKAIWSCKEGKRSSLAIEQKPSSSGTLAPHRARVGIFKKHGEELEFNISVDAAYSTKLTALAVPDSECPDFIYPNLDDKDYALFSLDEISVKSSEKVLKGGVKDPLLRLLVWNTLYQMVRTGELSPVRYIEMAILGLASEDDDGVLGVLLGRRSGLRGLWSHYLSPQDREKFAPALEAMLWKRVLAEAKGSSRQMSFYDFYARVAQSKQALRELATILEKNSPPAGIELDHDRRWSILYTLARNGHQNALTLSEQELKKDLSDSGKRAAYAVRVAFPDLEAKKKFWQEILSPEKIPPSTLSAAANEFHQPSQLTLSETFTQEYFQRIQSLNFGERDQLVEIYFDGLFPHNVCSKKLLEKSRQSLKKARKLSPLARRSWLEANDELARCVSYGRR